MLFFDKKIKNSLKVDSRFLGVCFRFIFKTEHNSVVLPKIVFKIDC